MDKISGINSRMNTLGMAMSPLMKRLEASTPDLLSVAGSLAGGADLLKTSQVAIAEEDK